MFTELLNWRLWLATALLAGLIGTHVWAYRQGANRIQAKWDAQIILQAQETARLVETVRITEQTLQAKAESLRKAKNAEINDLATKYADAVNSLSKRPSRSENNLPTDTGTGRGCYPSELFREDAKVAIDLATEADRLRASLAYCQSQYSKIRNQLKGEK